MLRPPLSTTETGKAWLSQFALLDRPAAASLLDALMLMNDEQVATALRSLLADLAELRPGLRKRVALYAERVGGAGRWGFGDSAALIAFSYGIPNNTPLILHGASESWRPLFSGAAPLDLRSAFRLQSSAERVKLAAAAIGIDLAPDLSPPHAEIMVFLRAIRGHWRTGAQTAIAEMTGMTEPEVLAAMKRASDHGYLEERGRLTDAGQAALGAAERSGRKRPTVATNPEPYYPLQLRSPRGSSSISRPSGRPR